MMTRKKAVYSQFWQGSSSSLIASTKAESMQLTWCSAYMWCCECSSASGEKVSVSTHMLPVVFSNAGSLKALISLVHVTAVCTS